MRRYGRRLAGALTAAAVMAMTACGSGDDPGPSYPDSGTATVDVGGREVTVHVPDSYDPARPAPLVVGLHGYTSDGPELESYLRLTPESDRHGFVYATPNGTKDRDGERYWNATDACCAFSAGGPDDSQYLSDLIAALQREYRIDAARVYLIGHSNGGFMSFRMACDHAGQIAAIVSIAGATWNDDTRCRPSEPVGVLAVHGDSDTTIRYDGGANAGIAYPSAAGTVARWREHNGCAATGRAGAALDLVAEVAGAETSVLTYDQGCADGSVVALWTMKDTTHVPNWAPGLAPAVTEFLLSRTG